MFVFSIIFTNMSLQQYTTALNQAASNQDIESIKKVVDEVKVDSVSSYSY